MVEHELAWTLTNLKRDGLVEKPKWGIWKLTGSALTAMAEPVAAAVGAERLAELRAMPYQQYLRTPEWRQTKAAALLCAGNACSLDVTHTEGLEVHHRTYERRGAELMDRPGGPLPFLPPAVPPAERSSASKTVRQAGHAAQAIITSAAAGELSLDLVID